MEIQSEYKIRNKIWIEPDMFYSEAFIGFSASAIKTLMRCLQKRKWEKMKVNGKKQIVYSDDGFIFPYAEAAALKIAKKTQHWKNIIKLIELGFLDLVHQGGWYRKHERLSDFSVYKFSERWRKYGTSEFVTVEKPKVLPKHFHIRENIKRQKLKVTSLERTGQVHNSEHDSAISDNSRVHDNEAEEQATESRRSFTTIA